MAWGSKLLASSMAPRAARRAAGLQKLEIIAESAGAARRGAAPVAPRRRRASRRGGGVGRARQAGMNFSATPLLQ